VAAQQPDIMLCNTGHSPGRQARHDICARESRPKTRMTNTTDQLTAARLLAEDWVERLVQRGYSGAMNLPIYSASAALRGAHDRHTRAAGGWRDAAIGCRNYTPSWCSNSHSRHRATARPTAATCG
jgi:hypothetical protein